MKIEARDIVITAGMLIALLAGLIGGIGEPLSLLSYIVITAVWLVYTRKPVSIGITCKEWAGNVLWGLASGSVAALITLPIYIYFPQTSAHFFEFPRMLAERTGITSIGIILPLLVLGYSVGSLLHELFYRGLLQKELSRRTGTAGAILAAALLFGWAHFPEGIFSMIIGFYEGLICGVLFNRRKSILAPWCFRIGHMAVILTVLFLLRGVRL